MEQMTQEQLDAQTLAAQNANKQDAVSTPKKEESMPTPMLATAAAAVLAKMANPIITREYGWVPTTASTGNAGIKRVLVVDAKVDGKDVVVAWEQTQFAPKDANLGAGATVDEVLASLKVQPRSLIGATVSFKANGKYTEFVYGGGMTPEEIVEESKLSRYDANRENRRLAMLESERKAAEAKAAVAEALTRQVVAEQARVAAASTPISNEAINLKANESLFD